MNLEIYTPPVFEIFMPCGKPMAGVKLYSARVRARKGGVTVMPFWWYQQIGVCNICKGGKGV